MGGATRGAGGGAGGMLTGTTTLNKGTLNIILLLVQVVHQEYILHLLLQHRQEHNGSDLQHLG